MFVHEVVKALQTISSVCHYYFIHSKFVIFRFCSIYFDTYSTKSKNCPFECVAHCAVSAIIGFPLLALKSKRIPSRSPVSSDSLSFTCLSIGHPTFSFFFFKKAFCVPQFLHLFSVFLNRRYVEFRIQQLLYVFTGLWPQLLS